MNLTYSKRLFKNENYDNNTSIKILKNVGC